MKKFFLIISCFCVSNSFAQNYTENSDFSLKNGTLTVRSTSINEDLNEKDYIGGYKEGKVSGYSESVPYRYNANKDIFEFTEANKRKELIKNLGQKITFFDGIVYEYLNFMDSKESITSGYLEVLTKTKGKYTLYKSTRIKVSDSLNKNAYDGSASGKNYRTEISYYLSDSNNIVSLPKTSKKIENILKTDVQNIVKTNKLNLSKEQDLIKLVDILNK